LNITRLQDVSRASRADKYSINESDESFSLQNFPANKIFVIEIYSNEET
jgi:hypothetical protein